MSLSYEAKKSNTELVNDMMEFSPYGALSQIFIIEAIRYYSEKVLANSRPTTPGESMINHQTWWDVAKNIKERMDDNYENRNST